MLYHNTLGFPSTLSLPIGIFRLSYTNHAKQEANKENILYSLPYKLNTQKATLIEVETPDNRRVVKIVYRLPLTTTHDIVIVAIPNRQPWTVKTVWLNHVDDTHRTLNRGNYDKVCNR